MTTESVHKIHKGVVVSGGNVKVDLHPKEALDLGNRLVQIGSENKTAQVEIAANGPRIIIKEANVKEVF